MLLNQQAALVAVIALLGVAACTSDAPPAPDGSASGTEISLTTDRSSYAPGDQVSVELVNVGDIDVVTNLCFGFLDLEVMVDGIWSETEAFLGPKENTFCNTIGHLIRPRDRDEGTVYLPADLAPGTYRVAYEASFDGSRPRITTEPFDVS